VEQLLSSCGGWQDQAGGLLGGIRLTTSQPQLPLTLHTTALPVPTALQQHERIALVFMGKPRLARDLLQVLPIQYVLIVVVNESACCV
jgi:fucokinase